MRGTVRLISEDGDLMAVETEHGEYTVCGLLGDDPLAVGDEISGPLDARDQQTLRNETQGIDMSVYVEEIELTLEAAREAVGT